MAAVAAVVAVSWGVASFDTGSEDIGTSGAAGGSCLGSLGPTSFGATLGTGALALIIGTAGRAGITGTGMTGAILCTAAVVAEEGAVDIEVDGFMEPASEGGRVAVGVGISDTEDFAGVDTAGTETFTSGLGTGTGTGAGTGASTGAGAGAGIGASTGASTGADTGTSTGAGAGAATGASTGVDTGVSTGAGTAAGTRAGVAVATFLRRRRLLAGNGSSGADNHGNLINLSAI